MQIAQLWSTTSPSTYNINRYCPDTSFNLSGATEMQQHGQRRLFPRFDKILMVPFSSAVMVQVVWASHKHLMVAIMSAIHRLAISFLMVIFGTLKQWVMSRIYHPNMRKNLSQVRGNVISCKKSTTVYTITKEIKMFLRYSTLILRCRCRTMSTVFPVSSCANSQKRNSYGILSSGLLKPPFRFMYCRYLRALVLLAAPLAADF